ncbi:MAG: efflux RND transporter permease subunit [Lachnospiraceae bacterium]|nr:efflux RND transporter permease subunit [Lachnospiraceae bacterium]
MLSKFSVKKPFTVVVAVILVIILGVVAYTEMTPDLLPSMDFPYAIVMTTYPGASPEEVETMVTTPIESVVATLNNVKNIRSTSSENYSLVVLEFNDEANMDSITVDMRESLDKLEDTWDEGVGKPVIMKINPDIMPVQVDAIDVKGLSTDEISKYVEENVVPELEAVEGVASVSPTGMVDKQINVVLNQDKIANVNSKILASVTEDLDDAENKMKDAKDDLESKQSDLSSKSKQLFSQSANATAQFDAAKYEMILNEIKMSTSVSEMEKQEKQIQEGLKEVASQKKKTLDGKKLLLENKQKAESGLKTLNENIPKVKDGILAGESTIAELEKAIHAIEGNDALSDIEKEAQLTVLKENLNKAKDETDKAKGTLATLEAQKKTAEDGLKEIDTNLKNVESGLKKIEKSEKDLNAGLKQIQSGKKQVQDGQNKLNEGKSQLSSKQVEANTQINSATSQLSTAQSQLSTGVNQLNEKIDGFDDTRKEAEDKADISGTINSDMIIQFLKAQNFAMPAGYVVQGNEDYLVRVGDKVEDVEELKNLVIFNPQMDGVDPVKVSDVADVFWSDNSDETYAKINGNPGVVLTIQKQNTYSTAQVSKSITKKLDQLKDQNKDLRVTNLMDQGFYIKVIVDAVMNNLILGAILAILILLLFLQDIRPTVIIACSIPISVIFAIVLMYFSGITLNMISLSGLAVGVGMLVDNSVVVIENIYRLRSKGFSRVKAAVSGASQVAGAITSSTLTTVCVFLPIVFVKGITRQLFTDMALTIAYSLLASLIVALTLVPTMSSNMLKKTKERKHTLFNGFVRIYEKVLRFTLRHKLLTILAVVALLIVSAIASFSRGTSFMPEMDSTQISVEMEMPEDTTLEDTVAMSDEIVQRIQKIEGVDTVGAMLSGGRAASFGVSTDVATDAVSMYVVLKEDKKITSQEIASRIEDSCKDLDCEVKANGSTMDMSALGSSGIVINVEGNDLDQLKDVAQDVAAKLEKVDGIQEVSDGIEDPTPQLEITIDKAKAMKKGLTVGQIFQDIQKNIADGKTATNLSMEGKNYSIVVNSEESQEMTTDDIRNYTLETTDKDGKKKNVKLKNIADIKEGISLSAITREGQQRYISISGELKDGYNVGLVSRDVKAAFEKYELPDGIELSFQGEDETINESMEQLLKMLLLAIAFIYLIMVAQFQSLKSPFIVMFTIPLAFTGGFLGLFLTGMDISIISMIGFVMLAGIVVNNGIVLVDYINQLRLDGMEKKEAIVDAGITRMRPVLMTALTTVLGLSTMALGIGMGADMMQPIAIVTIGGLLYATITTLFVIPILYDLFNRKEMKKLKEEDLEIVMED